MRSTPRFSSRSIIFRTKLLDGLISSFSWFMTGGHAWILFIAANALFDRKRAVRACRILPALYLATYTVEIPIKR